MKIRWTVELLSLIEKHYGRWHNTFGELILQLENDYRCQYINVDEWGKTHLKFNTEEDYYKFLLEIM